MDNENRNNPENALDDAAQNPNEIEEAKAELNTEPSEAEAKAEEAATEAEEGEEAQAETEEGEAAEVEPAEEPKEDLSEATENAQPEEASNESEPEGKAGGFADSVRRVKKNEDTEFCALCGENPCEPESDYCSECEAKMSKNKIPFVAWLAGTAAICLSIMAFVIVCITSGPAAQALKGDINASKSCWYSAYNEYSQVDTVMEEINSILGGSSPLIKVGSGIKVKMIKAISECYSPMDAINYALNYFDEDFIAKNPTLKGIYANYKKSMDTYTVIGDTLSELFYGEGELDETVKALEEFRGKEGVDEVALDHFIFIAADYCNVTGEEKLEYLRKLDETAKKNGGDYYWIYYQDMANQLFLLGKGEEALEYVNVLIEKDRSNFGAHELKLRILLADNKLEEAKALVDEYSSNNEGYDTDYMLQMTYNRFIGDYDAVKAIFEEADETYDSVPELHRQLCLIYLLEEDYDTAFEEAFRADANAYYIYSYMGDSSAYTPQLSNTLYLATYLCKEKGMGTSENAQYIEEILESFEDEDISEQVTQIIEGKLTIEKALTEGVCDLA